MFQKRVKSPRFQGYDSGRLTRFLQLCFIITAVSLISLFSYNTFFASTKNGEMPVDNVEGKKADNDLNSNLESNLNSNLRGDSVDISVYGLNSNAASVKEITKFDVRRCSVQEAMYQASVKDAAKIRGCPPKDDIWIRLVHLIMPDATVFIDIGSNKGYTAARFFSLWSPEMQFTPKKLHSALKSVSTEKSVLECGACADCTEDNHDAFTSIQDRLCSDEAKHSSNPNQQNNLEKATKTACDRFNSNKNDVSKSIKIYSFDGNDILISATTKARDYTRLSGLRDGWKLELAAFSDVYIPRKTMNFILDGELGHLEDSRPNDKELNSGKVVKKVPVFSVDFVAGREDLPKVDFLKIDTEGHDLTVLQGALETLRAGKVTLLLFEYNTFWPEVFRGSAEPLATLIKQLQDMDYICYMEGKNVLLRLSFCWNSILGERQWSNVWCAYAGNNKGTAIISVFDSYSLAFI